MLSLKFGLRLTAGAEAVSPNPITGTGPVLASLTDGQELGDAVTWGSYLPEDVSVSRQMQVDGGEWVAFDGETVVSEGEVWRVREVVTLDAWSRTFTSNSVIVDEAPEGWIISGSMVLQSPVPPSPPNVSGSIVS